MTESKVSWEAVSPGMEPGSLLVRFAAFQLPPFRLSYDGQEWIGAVCDATFDPEGECWLVTYYALTREACYV